MLMLQADKQIDGVIPEDVDYLARKIVHAVMHLLSVVCVYRALGKGINRDQ